MNWPAEWIAEARDARVAEPCAAQLPYNLVQRSPVEDEDMIEALGPMGVVASFVLAGGALTGKYPGARPAVAASSTTRATRRRCARRSGCGHPAIDPTAAAIEFAVAGAARGRRCSSAPRRPSRSAQLAIHV